ncbi:MAG: hypothetical protein VYB89_14180, partial [Pseudomonadota bacterium]|nr:hypothetical protein [Pseudomonadota bacterium]
MATVEPSAGGGTSGSNRWEKAVYGVLAAVTAAAGLYWLIAANAGDDRADGVYITRQQHGNGKGGGGENRAGDHPTDRRA